ncbi:unnamed protein product [Clavelina lepadiformis]|uniref:Uncharacterized protein n=1 Tax=Clavelina lepadiformis TaxID=159417 RepID=A0ABP0G462_CLALP
MHLTKYTGQSCTWKDLPFERVAVCSPGVVARACNPVTWKLELLNNLKLGIVRYLDLCRTGVRDKLSVNMVVLWERKVSRLSKEERTGSGPKGSNQKFPR